VHFEQAGIGRRLIERQANPVLVDGDVGDDINADVIRDAANPRPQPRAGRGEHASAERSRAGPLSVLVWCPDWKRVVDRTPAGPIPGGHGLSVSAPPQAIQWYRPYRQGGRQLHKQAAKVDR